MHDGSITVICKNDLAEVEPLQSTLARFCKLHGVPSRHQHALNLALDEAVTNIVKHGLGANGAHQIRVQVRLDGTDFSAQIEDDGPEFNPTKYPAVDCTKSMGERPLGGLGIHLVRSLVTKLEYRRENGKNVLTLLKRVQ